MNYTAQQTHEKRQNDIKALHTLIMQKGTPIANTHEEIFKLCHAFASETSEDYEQYFMDIASLSGIKENQIKKIWNKNHTKAHQSNINTFFYMCQQAGYNIKTEAGTSPIRTKASHAEVAWDKNARLTLWICFKENTKYEYLVKETGKTEKNNKHSFYSKKAGHIEPTAREAINFFFKKIEKFEADGTLHKANIYFNLNRGNQIENAQNICVYQYNRQAGVLTNKTIATVESLPYLALHKLTKTEDISTYIYQLEELEHKRLIKKGQAEQTKAYIMQYLNRPEQLPASLPYHQERTAQNATNENTQTYNFPSYAPEMEQKSPQLESSPQHQKKQNFKEKLKSMPNIPSVPMEQRQKIDRFVYQINALSDEDFLLVYEHNDRKTEINNYIQSFQNQ